MVSISVISHAQLRLIHLLLEDIKQYCVAERLEVILTLNTIEELPFSVQDFPFAIKIITNTVPKGFAANHNAAFEQAQGEFFCVVNPDIRLRGDPFPALRQCLFEQDVGVAAPLILNEQGKVEDSARTFPTPFSLLGKALGLRKQLDYTIGDQLLFPDWLGGMFLLFPSVVYRKIDGFDERFFLYYEDVDLCARLLLSGYLVVLNPAVPVIHEARRASHRNLKYLRWHVTSMMRFIFSLVFLKLQWRRFCKSTVGQCRALK